MNSDNSAAIEALAGELRASISGEVRDDRLSRALYSTDASIYQITPDVVVLPKSVDDVVQTVKLCGKHQVPITARGGGTGLAGGCVNHGVQLDCARHLNRVIEINTEERWVKVEPGVVLDELNAECAKHGLTVLVDVATSNRATLGGMIANNSCGAHSVKFGRTVDHLMELDVVLADGSRFTWGAGQAAEEGSYAKRCEEALAAIGREYADEIATRYPKVLRRNAGYGLDRLEVGNGRINVESVLCGSEGTLGVIVGAKLRLTPLPALSGLMVIHYETIAAALEAVPPLLEHDPAAIELIDKLILDAASENSAMRRRRWFIDGDPGGVLVVEFYDDTVEQLTARFDRLAEELDAAGSGYAKVVITDPVRQKDVWEVRKAGLGLLMSQPGDVQPYAFIEDAAIEPKHLAAYTERLMTILADEGVGRVGAYAHASVGCLHFRPALNLKERDDIERMHRIADKVFTAVVEFGGTITGEHGDGIIRAEWLEKMYGPKLIEAFRKVKTAFDPHGILNPRKMVDPYPMTANLRLGEGFESLKVDTWLDFDKFGGMAGLAGMCTGVGQCRQRLVGTMCPSYMATNDETHTTRARANALRQAMSNRGILDGLDDPALEEVFALCLSCKACKTECPTNTDVAKLKAEWMAHKIRSKGLPRKSRMIAQSIEMAAWGSRFAPVANMLMQSKIARVFLEHWFGFDRRVPPPKFAGKPFRKWFAQRAKPDSDAAERRPRVVYFVDTWVNYYTPQVGKAAVKVLEALGFEVIVPPTVCCGRPLISQGMLAEAKLLAEDNAEILSPFAGAGLPIIGTEPSCISTLMDEMPELCRTEGAKRVSQRAVTIETFVAQQLRERPDALTFKPGTRPLLYHGHCHQKALIGTGDAMAALGACCGGGSKEIDAGCCGMAGAFGHMKDNYEVSKAVGEQRLFPAVRSRGDAEIAVSGFSCRHQIEHHTGVKARHAIEVIAEALA